MRLFAKVFLCVVAVISLSLLISGYMLITSSHESTIQREVDRALNQYQLDRFSLQASEFIDKPAEDEQDVYQSLNLAVQELYGHHAVLRDDREVLISTLPLPLEDSAFYQLREPILVHQILEHNQAYHLLIYGKFSAWTYDFYLVSSTDITDMIHLHQQM